jgi:hypothetical protein
MGGQTSLWAVIRPEPRPSLALCLTLRGPGRMCMRPCFSKKLASGSGSGGRKLTACEVTRFGPADDEPSQAYLTFLRPYVGAGFEGERRHGSS